MARERYDEKISQQLGNLVGVYLQGFCGDTRPKLIKDNEFYRGSLSKESEEMSELFYQEIKTVFSSPKEKIEIKDIEYREEEVFLPSYNPDILTTPSITAPVGYTDISILGLPLRITSKLE